MVYVRHCLEYCDEQCQRAPDHEGEHYANGNWWRPATGQEQAVMKAEREAMMKVEPG